jgi:hypothetical protein
MIVLQLFDKTNIEGGFKFLAKDQRFSFMTALNLLERKDSQFLASFLDVLRNETSFKSYYFETPPMTDSTVSQFSSFTF